MKNICSFENFIYESESKDSMENLRNMIRTRAKRSSGESSNVIYLSGDSHAEIAGYENLKPYSAQASGEEVKVNFMDKEKMYIFSNRIDKKKEDRSSFEKYGGLIYIMIPLTDEIAAEIMKKLQ